MRTEKLLQERLNQVFSDYGHDFDAVIDHEDSSGDVDYFSGHIDYTWGDFHYSFDMSYRVQGDDTEYCVYEDVYRPVDSELWQWLTLTLLHDYSKGDR